MDLPILTGSMSPHLVPGGRLQLDCSPSLRPRLGDVVVYREQDRLIAHRLLLRVRLGRRCWLYQKGDAARTGSWVNAAGVIGVVVGASGPDGEPTYARGPGRPSGGRGAAGAGVHRQLLRDLAARARSALRVLRRRGAARRGSA